MRTGLFRTFFTARVPPRWRGKGYEADKIPFLPRALVDGYALAMEPSRPRNAWLRMTDSMGLTEPGKKPQRQSPKTLLFFTVLWSLSAVVWSVQVVRDVSMGTSDYYLKVVLAVAFLILAIAYYVMWRNSRKGHQ